MKVGITFSTFDLLHAGHVKMLEDAKRQFDYLIVGLQLDPSKDRPEENTPFAVYYRALYSAKRIQTY